MAVVAERWVRRWPDVGGQCRLRRWPADSFFPALLFWAGDTGGKRRRSSTWAHDDAGLARIGPRSDRDRVLLLAAGEPARKFIVPWWWPPRCADRSLPVGWRDSISSLPTSCVRRRAKLAPSRCCWPLSLIRCGGPSATRTRTAAKRALSFPFVPVRQLIVCHFTWASMSSAGIDRMSGTCRWRGRPRLATGQIIRTSAGYTLRWRGIRPSRSVCELWDPDGTERSTHNRHPLRRSQSAHWPRWHDRSPPEPTRLRSCRSIFGRDTRSIQPGPIARPTLGKKQPQRQHERYFTSR